MPNWCNNTLELQHDDPAMIERAKKAFAEGKLLAEFVPVPESLQIVAGSVGDDNDPAQKKLIEDTERNLEVHGYGNWYDYCVNEWGTKWDVGGDDGSCDQDGPNNLTMGFDSAWAPPTAAMEKFVELGFKVTLYYYESGMCFAGVWEDGIDDFYELGNMSAEEVANTIPSELDIRFCISESMAEWEEDNKEELE